MGDVRLRAAGGAHHLFWLVERGQGNRQHAHGGAVAGVVFVGRPLGGAGFPKAQNAASNGIADVRRLGAHPGIEGLGGGLRAHMTGGEYGLAQCQGHGGVVGDLAGFEFEPATADHPVVGSILSLDLARGHELDRRAQGIADGETQVGGYGAAVG